MRNKIPAILAFSVFFLLTSGTVSAETDVNISNNGGNSRSRVCVSNNGVEKCFNSENGEDIDYHSEDGSVNVEINNNSKPPSPSATRSPSSTPKPSIHPSASISAAIERVEEAKEKIEEAKKELKAVDEKNKTLFVSISDALNNLIIQLENLFD